MQREVAPIPSYASAPTNEPACTGPISSVNPYRAFISYSHGSDTLLAAALQRALERVAKPWFRRSAVRIFRDQTSLSASPELWAEIEKNLARCDHFILMASVSAAASRWVNLEVQWWLTHRTLARLLIVVTDGEIERARDGSDFDWARSTCLPEALRGQFKNEPLWVDMRSPTPGERLAPKSARFRDAVLTLAAPLHGRSKDELDSADLQEHRRLKLAATLAMVVVAVSAGSAWWSYGSARQQAQRADGNWREAQSRRLAALSLETLRGDKNINEAIQLAVLAWRLEPTQESQAALREMERASADVARILGHHTGRVVALAFSPDSAQLASMGEDSSILVWSTTALDAAPRLLSDGLNGRSALINGYGLQFDAQGKQLLAWGSNGAAEVWDLARGERSATLPAPEKKQYVTAVGFSADGSLIAFVAERELQVWNVAQRQAVAVPKALAAANTLALHFGADGSLSLMQRLGQAFRFATWKVAAGSVLLGPPTRPDYGGVGRGFACFALGGRSFALALSGRFSLWQVEPTLALRRFDTPADAPGDYDEQLACAVGDSSALIAANTGFSTGWRWQRWTPGGAWALQASGALQGGNPAWSADQRWLATVLKDKVVVTALQPRPDERASVSLTARCRINDHEGDEGCWRSLCRKVAPSLHEDKLRTLFGIRDYEVFYDTFKSRIDASLCESR